MENKSLNTLATWVYAIHRALTEQGHDAEAIMRSVGFEFSSLASTTQRIPKEQLNAIWQAAEEATGNDAFSFSTFSHLNDPYLNALVTSAQASSSIHQAIQILLRYYQVVTSSSKLHFEVNDHVELHITSVDGQTPVSSQDVDLVFGLVSKYGSVLPVTEIHPKVIYMERSRPNNLEAYEQHYDCELVFDAKKNVLHFPLDILNAEIPSANPVLSNHVEQYLAEQTTLTNDIESKDSGIKEMVARAISELLPKGTPKLKDIAAKLSIGERTLQRKLKQEGISYSDLLNQTRLELAKTYLCQTSQPIQNIAYKLGFSEPGNFIRFFKQHMGITPNSFANSSTK